MEVGLGVDSRSKTKAPYSLISLLDVLQFEIVTPDGKLRTANEFQNKDLFWALRGGGPGFGVGFHFLFPVAY